MSVELSTATKPVRSVSESSRHALEVPSVLRVLAGFAATELGASRVCSLEPLADGELRTCRAAQQEIAWLCEQGGVLVGRREEEFAGALARLESERSSLGTEHLLTLCSLLECFEEAVRRLGSDATPTLYLELERSMCREAEDEDPAAQQIERAVGLARSVRAMLDGKGNIRANATPRLAELTAGVRSQRESLYQRLRVYAREHGDVLADDTISPADGRLAVLLPAGHRGRLDGIVHGRSSSEKSYYFEPLELVDDNNRLKERQSQEEAERERILSELARAFREHATLITGVAEFVGCLDCWQAAVRFAVDVVAELPDFLSAEPDQPSSDSDAPSTRAWELRGLRHPLLDPRLAALREAALGTVGHRGEVVPLALAADERALVITGPNAGGKTVALKTIGVCSYLAACGWPLPGIEGQPSQVPRFERIMAVVGDEQDVLADRSTFSAKLERLRAIWETADRSTLVLLDEMGSGTNPEEGAALTIALLEELVGRGCYVVMTTHLLQVANAALADSGCQSLRMELEAESGVPTYQIQAGAPGSSHALELARRLELAPAWLTRAEELLGAEQLTLRHLIADTEAARQRAAETEAELAAALDEQKLLQRRMQMELEELGQERSKARKKVQSELESFRRSARDELTRAVQQSRAKAEQSASGQGRSARTAEREAARVAAQLVEQSALSDSLQELGAADEQDTSRGRDPVEGDQVRHRSLGWSGTLEAVRGTGKNARAEVNVRGKRVSCRLPELMVAESGGSREPSKRRRPAVDVSRRGADVGIELMLVGERVEPALAKLDAYLDQALLANLERGRVVHGFGSGRLRKAVREHLRSHAAVAEFRSAPHDEGGDGATVVVFRD